MPHPKAGCRGLTLCIHNGACHTTSRWYPSPTATVNNSDKQPECQHHQQCNRQWTKSTHTHTHTHTSQQDACDTTSGGHLLAHTTLSRLRYRKALGTTCFHHISPTGKAVALPVCKDITVLAHPLVKGAGCHAVACHQHGRHACARAAGVASAGSCPYSR